MHILIQWLINAVAVYATAHILDGIHIKSFGAAILVALVLGLVNAVVRPVLVFFSIPFIIVTLGLFLLVINALMLLLVARVVRGFTVSGFWTAFFASLFISILSMAIGTLAPNAETTIYRLPDSSPHVIST
jgi:putative membrane protein